MAKETITRLVDDIDGGVAHETVRFGLDGVLYEIDLSSRNAKKLRSELSGVMQACGAVRDRDIAIGLLTESGMATDSKLVRSLQNERRAADRDLRRDLTRGKHRGLGKKFQSLLEA